MQFVSCILGKRSAAGTFAHQGLRDRYLCPTHPKPSQLVKGHTTSVNQEAVIETWQMVVCFSRPLSLAFYRWILLTSCCMNYRVVKV